MSERKSWARMTGEWLRRAAALALAFAIVHKLRGEWTGPLGLILGGSILLWLAGALLERRSS